MNIEMALRSRSYILDLDRVRLSFGIFFFLSYLMETILFTSFQDLPFFWVKITHQKAANLMFRLILPVAKDPWLFLEVQYIGLSDVKKTYYWARFIDIQSMVEYIVCICFFF